ncbi:hypothetical protein [Anaeromyxobacter terrae]|uniref:hypothetical protein n=1 Tax=Anaeromyxobacter terrae TaxID=2925406 RepID=UPI001F58AD90|nr:hypothetical protein [Anaeromyxobacter sp. SG22]
MTARTKPGFPVFGQTTRKLADDDRDPGPVARAAIREAVRPVVEDLRHRMNLVALGLTGPDPEYALWEFVEALRAVPAALQSLERELSKPIGSTSRRAA